MKNIFSKTRVEAFSDGIFAIIITLLVLEIKVPHIHEHHSANELVKALSGLLPKFIGWVYSPLPGICGLFSHTGIFYFFRK